MFRSFHIIIREFRRSLLKLLHIHDLVRKTHTQPTALSTTDSYATRYVATTPFYKNELNHEYVITLARNDEIP